MSSGLMPRFFWNTAWRTPSALAMFRFCFVALPPSTTRRRVGRPPAPAARGTPRPPPARPTRADCGRPPRPPPAALPGETQRPALRRAAAVVERDHLAAERVAGPAEQPRQHAPAFAPRSTSTSAASSGRASSQADTRSRSSATAGDRARCRSRVSTGRLGPHGLSASTRRRADWMPSQVARAARGNGEGPTQNG